MNFKAALVLLAALALGSTGCVAQRRADDLQRGYRQAQEQIIDLLAQLEEKNAQIAALQNAGPDADSLARINELQAERDRLQEALAAAEAQLRNVSAEPVALPEPLDTALRELADQYPDLMTYDPALGMVKFRSDLTFALGSAEVNPQATQTLERLAQVLRSPEAQGYEVRVVGHTDAVPVNNPTTRQRHPDNWYLSAHRAISVKDVLEQAGVQPGRLGVAGYAQYRPVVPNGPKGQAEQNRRVEIYLVEMPLGRLQDAATDTPDTPEAAPAATEEPAPASAAPEMYK